MFYHKPKDSHGIHCRGCDMRESLHGKPVAEDYQRLIRLVELAGEVCQDWPSGKVAEHVRTATAQAQAALALLIHGEG